MLTIFQSQTSYFTVQLASTGIRVDTDFRNIHNVMTDMPHIILLNDMTSHI